MTCKILIVEDNALNLDMLTRRLQKKGYEIITAINGQQGIELASSELPDLILMDWNLPVLNGLEATKRIKANEITKKIPLIILTAYAMVGDSEEAFAAGCDEYETKPIDFPQLLNKIERLLKFSSSL